MNFDFLFTPAGINCDTPCAQITSILMKNKILSFVLSLFLGTSLLAQDWNSASDLTTGFTSINEAAKMAKQIVDAAGLKANFKIAEARVPNAMAVVHQGKRYILYNPRFINLLTRATGTKWSAISVLAHEIGHHLYSPSVNKGKQPMATELEADQFSGFVLEKMGATLDEAEAAISLLATTEATATHPGRADRIRSIAKGWNNAGGIEEEREREGDAVAITIPPADENENTVLPEKYILASVHFNADPRTAYYVTTRLNLVKVEDDKLQVIGKLARLNNTDYPYVIYDGEGTHGYVNNTGDIVTKRGATVGRLNVRG
jgi:hypothetical protein